MIKNNVMVAKQNKKYKNGSVSMVAVLFGTTVMSLICISFIKAITSGQNQNNMYTQSQAAYDASITGINDTQLAISECIRNPSSISDPSRLDKCNTILNGSGNCKETIIAVEYVLFGESRGGVIDEESNQSYNCITITPNSRSYQGVLRSGNDDGVVIPIIQDADYVRVSYGINLKTNEVFSGAQSKCDPNSTYLPLYGYNDTLMNRANELCSGKNFYNFVDGDYGNLSNYARELFAPPISFELSQNPEKFNLTSLSDDSWNNQNTNTNTGYLALSPTYASDTDPRTIIKNESVDMGDGNKILVGLAGSVDKANNSPVSINCRSLGEGYRLLSGKGAKYSCSTDIKLPSPQGGTNRDPNNSFIRLTMPSVEMTNGVPFEVSFHNAQTSSGDPINSPLKMDRTQYLVSVNGKTGERVRRTEAYIGGMSNDEAVPLWSASVGGAIVKCGTGATRELSDCGDLTEAEVKRYYRNTADYYICAHTYLTEDSDGLSTDGKSKPDNFFCDRYH